MVDLWVESGYYLLDKTENEFLAVAGDFLRANFLRPELEPVNSRVYLYSWITKKLSQVFSANGIVPSQLQINTSLPFNFIY
jgi:hypothetical protein